MRNNHGTKIDKNTEIIYHIHTNEPEKLPKRRAMHGFDNRSFWVNDERADNELDSINYYRVFKQAVPDEYNVTAVTVGFNTDGKITWTGCFRIE